MAGREHRKKGPSRRGAALRNAGLALGSALLTVVAFELFVFHVLDVKPPGYAPERFFRYSSLTGHALRPNAEGYWYRYADGTKFRVRINAFGFGDAERSLEKTRRRIALIGDSTTQFWEAEPQQRGHVLLEEQLGGKWEVLNFGVRDFGTDQSLLLLEHAGFRFRPDIVVYTFCINDISDNARRDTKPYFVEDATAPDGLSRQEQPAKKLPVWIEQYRERTGFLRLHSYLYRRSAPAAKRWLQALRGGDAAIPPFIEIDPYRRQYPPPYARDVDRTLKLVSRLDRAVHRHGAKLLVVEGVYRPAMEEGWRRRIVAQYGDEFDFDKPSRLLARHAAAEGIAFLSLPRLARRRGIEASGLMHPEDVMHLDARGIRFQTDAVAEKLRALGWVGTDAQRV